MLVYRCKGRVLDSNNSTKKRELEMSQTITVETITPEMAASYRATNANNRPISRSRLEAYCKDLKEGNWFLTHQGIAFDEHGRLVDGHHRMEMIIRTGIPVQMIVTRGLGNSAVIGIDSGWTRTVRDSLYMSGIGDFPRYFVVVATNIERFPDKVSNATHRITPVYAEEMINKHFDAIQFVDNRFRGDRKGTGRGFRCAVARAYYHVNRDLLGRFCDIIKNPVPTEETTSEDSSAFALSRFITSSSRGVMVEIERYQKTCSAIRSFVDRKPIRSLYAAVGDIYPLPN